MAGFLYNYMKDLEMRWKKVSERLSIVIPKDLKKRLDQLKKRLNLDQSTLIRILINQAIEEKEFELAIAEYQKGQITLGEAVLLANTDYWTMVSILHDRGIAANIDSEDHLKEIGAIHKKEYKKYMNANYKTL